MNGQSPSGKELEQIYAIADCASRVVSQIITDGHPDTASFKNLCHCLVEWEIWFPRMTIAERLDEIHAQNTLPAQGIHSGLYGRALPGEPEIPEPFQKP